MNNIVVAKSLLDFTQTSYLELSQEQDFVFNLKYYALENNLGVKEQYSANDYILVAESSVDISSKCSEGVMYGCYLTYENQISELVNMTTMYSSRSGESLLSLYGVSERNPFIIFSAFGDKNILIVNGTVQTNLTVIVRERAEMPKDIYADLVGEVYTRNAARGNQKRQLLADLDPNRSLSYMESQLDILTKAVQVLLKNNPKALIALKKELPAWDDFSTKVDACSILTVKEASKCIEELNFKTAVRGLQKKYYESKS